MDATGRRLKPRGDSKGRQADSADMMSRISGDPEVEMLDDGVLTFLVVYARLS